MRFYLLGGMLSGFCILTLWRHMTIYLYGMKTLALSILMLKSECLLRGGFSFELKFQVSYTPLFQVQVLKTGEEAWLGDFTAWFGT